MELPFAALHMLCVPFLEGLERLPGLQRDALGSALGVSSGPPPDRFLVGVAMLSLLSDVAEAQPLVCLVDDAHWLDRASAQVLGFVARRLAAESVVLVLAVRASVETPDLAGLTEVTVGPLSPVDARTVLESAIPGKLDDSVRDRILAEAGGNPLALLELARAWTPMALAGGFGLPGNASVSAKIEEVFRRRLTPLPDDTKRLLLVAAADPVGDPVLVLAAAERLGIPAGAAEPARASDLLHISTQVRFRHPLVRSVVYREAPVSERRVVHRAIADVTDPAIDPDRRAWHLAAAAPGRDEDLAADLERSATRAQARGGVAAAAAFLQRAVALTKDPTRLAERALAAAEATLQAGAFDASLALTATAEAEALDEFQRARAHLIRARITFASDSRRDAVPLLLKTARRLEPFDLDMARETYLIAWFAADASLMTDVCTAVKASPRRHGTPRPLDMLLDGLVLLTTDGPAAATPLLQRAANALRTIDAEDVRRWGWAAPAASSVTWDYEGTLAIATRNMQIVRDAGALAELPVHVFALSVARTWIGDFAGAEAVVTESESVAASTTTKYALASLRAMQGLEPDVVALLRSAVEDAVTRDTGGEAKAAHWAAAILYNGFGRYAEATAAAREATRDLSNPWFRIWALPELVEAASRAEDAALAHRALEQLVETTKPAGTDFALGIEARARALLSEGGAAERLYREAIERLGRTQLRPELARAHLLYGEWLRREGRRIDARDQLRIAHDMFVAIGMEAFAERARRELQATGERVRKRSVETQDQLTPQEAQIARLASDGRTNPEIGAQLFLSRRTVEWHLRKVFDKLEVRSRRELPAALQRTGRSVAQ
jgi:DNA-binding CsgD family transcriptional regulator/tetratricopeptide (TPR) repeat protein